MIVFDLKCQSDHVFEAWFRSSKDFEDQRKCGMVSCPHCGTSRVQKAVMAPNVGLKGNARSDGGAGGGAGRGAGRAGARADEKSFETMLAPDGATPTPEQVRALLGAVRQHVEQNCENMGDNFTREARAIHYGDAPERGIYGNASSDEVRDLIDEGIDVMPILDPSKQDN